MGFDSHRLHGQFPNSVEEEAKVAAFVKKRGPKLKYTFAYADNTKTFDAWMKAAGREGIPCAFVVDKTGKIAYIGSPHFLGVVLPMVMAGDSPQAVHNRAFKVAAAFNRLWLFRSIGDDKTGLQALLDFEAKYPDMSSSPMLARTKLLFVAGAGDVNAATKYSEGIIARAIEYDDPTALNLVFTFLFEGQGQSNKELLAVALKAAVARAKLVGDHDTRALLDLADIYRVVGDMTKARP